MSPQAKYRTLALIAGVMIALGLLAAGLPGLTLAPGHLFSIDLPPPPAAMPFSGPMLPIFRWIVALNMIALAIVIVLVIFSRSARQAVLRILPAYLIMLLAIYLLIGNLMPQSSGPIASSPIQQRTPSEQLPEGSPVPATPDGVFDPPQWLVVLISLALGAGLALLIWRYRERFKPPPNQLAQLAEEARGALSELESGADLRDAVMRCYVEMGRVVHEQRGIKRDNAMTPREFEQRLAAVGLRDDHIRRLTRLFERVRYSSHAPGEREEREAIDCLRAIAEAYGRSP